MSRRGELQEVLSRYTTDTFTYMNTVREFCDEISTWTLKMEIEMLSMVDVKDRAQKMYLDFSHVSNAKNKAKAMGEYTLNKLSQVTAAGRREELEKELAAVLKVTLGGLEKLSSFLDAVEKLAVTSLHVFMAENQQVLRFPRGIRPELVQVVIVAARLICPLLLDFKRDAAVFFLPRLQNVEVLSYQLDKYIQTSQVICERFQESGVQNLFQHMNKEVAVDLGVDLTEDEIQRMLCHINQLDEIRMDPDFRMVFLFQEVSCSSFMTEFCKRKTRMLQFLGDLEESSVQLDRMSKGAKISSVAGSSVGAIGGALSIAGLVLIPVTAGLSLTLTITGVVLGITSGANSLVTTVTEMAVNNSQQKKANGVFQSFMDDMQSLQDCLEEVTSQPLTKIEVSKLYVAVGVGKVLNNVRALGNNIGALVEAVSATKMLRSEELMASAGMIAAHEAGAVGKGFDVFAEAASAAKAFKSEEGLVRVGTVAAQEGKELRNVPRLAADVPDVGQAAVKGPLALSKSARAGFIALNAFFIGMDVFFICRDGMSLAKGSETEVSQFIRARAALWSSEMDSWQKIHDSLREGLRMSEKHHAVLGKRFYPRKEIAALKTNIHDSVGHKM